jgi:hypothetical protein
MKCDEVAEYVSAVCDGQTIPREAAEHVGQCESCRTRLSEYVELGVELRRIASLESVGQTKVNRWQQNPRTVAGWWRRGWETMRIPRFAFALLVVMVVVLTCSLVVQNVRAHTRGRVLMLVAKPAQGHTLICSLSAGDRGMCKFAQMEGAESGRGLYELRAIADNGASFELGIRSARIYHQPSKDEVDQLPETTYTFRPGETLHVDVPGAGDLAINGEVWDHYPSPGELWDRMQSLENCR